MVSVNVLKLMRAINSFCSSSGSCAMMALPGAQLNAGQRAPSSAEYLNGCFETSCSMTTISRSIRQQSCVVSPVVRFK